MVFIMTKREFYNAVIEANISEAMTEQAKSYIATLDKTNEKRQAKKTEAQAEVYKVVLSVLTTEPVKAKAIVDAINATIDEGAIAFTSSKVVASCKRLADEGKVVITKEENGSRNISWYALAETDGKD
jgi:hypothetical protein